MAYLALSPVSAAVYAKLNVAGMTALVGTRIYDGVPQNPSFPFVLYEVQEQDDRGMGSGYGLPQVEILVHTFSQYVGYYEAQTIAQKAVELLRDVSLTVTGYSHAGKVFYNRTETIPDSELNGIACREVVSRFYTWVQES